MPHWPAGPRPFPPPPQGARPLHDFRPPADPQPLNDFAQPTGPNAAHDFTPPVDPRPLSDFRPPVGHGGDLLDEPPSGQDEAVSPEETRNFRPDMLAALANQSSAPSSPDRRDFQSEPGGDDMGGDPEAAYETRDLRGRPPVPQDDGNWPAHHGGPSTPHGDPTAPPSSDDQPGHRPEGDRSFRHGGDQPVHHAGGEQAAHGPEDEQSSRHPDPGQPTHSGAEQTAHHPVSEWADHGPGDTLEAHETRDLRPQFPAHNPAFGEPQGEGEAPAYPWEVAGADAPPYDWFADPVDAQAGWQPPTGFTAAAAGLRVWPAPVSDSPAMPPWPAATGEPVTEAARAASTEHAGGNEGFQEHPSDPTGSADATRPADPTSTGDSAWTTDPTGSAESTWSAPHADELDPNVTQPGRLALPPANPSHEDGEQSPTGRWADHGAAESAAEAVEGASVGDEVARGVGLTPGGGGSLGGDAARPGEDDHEDGDGDPHPRGEGDAEADAAAHREENAAKAQDPSVTAQVVRPAEPSDVPVWPPLQPPPAEEPQRLPDLPFSSDVWGPKQDNVSTPPHGFPPPEPPTEQGFATPQWAPPPPTPPGKTKRLLFAGLGVLIVVGVATGGFFVYRSMNTPNEASGAVVAQPTPTLAVSSTPTPSAASEPEGTTVLNSEDTDPRAMALSEAFPAKKIKVGKTVYTRVKTELSQDCSKAASGPFADALRDQQCTRVLRATYVDAKRRYAVTTGLAVLPTKDAALQADQAKDLGRNLWFRALPGPSGSGGERVHIAGGYAAGMVWGRYIVFSYATYADGHTPKPEEKGLSTVSGAFRDHTALVLERRVTGS
ncbi:hypothetical protein ACIBG7_04575 [Nonomuraea sp. NPDC050328]|uniref:hypothetical protein n=1 Tax=Nonomuraea sp. NPDC050328 TaxID=3364361 RepID=UPI0037B69062